MVRVLTALCYLSEADFSHFNPVRYHNNTVLLVCFLVFIIIIIIIIIIFIISTRFTPCGY